jgi:hypothetical protein
VLRLTAPAAKCCGTYCVNQAGIALQTSWLHVCCCRLLRVPAGLQCSENVIFHKPLFARHAAAGLGPVSLKACLTFGRTASVHWLCPWLIIDVFVWPPVANVEGCLLQHASWVRMDYICPSRSWYRPAGHNAGVAGSQMLRIHASLPCGDGEVAMAETASVQIDVWFFYFWMTCEPCLCTAGIDGTAVSVPQLFCATCEGADCRWGPSV